MTAKKATARQRATVELFMRAVLQASIDLDCSQRDLARFIEYRLLTQDAGDTAQSALDDGDPDQAYSWSPKDELHSQLDAAADDWRDTLAGWYEDMEAMALAFDPAYTRPVLKKRRHA